jgi:carbon storage regulator
MLVLSRKLNEAIIIDGKIRVTVVGLRGNQVRIGIEAPDSIAIFREELCDRFRADDRPEGLAAVGSAQETGAQLARHLTPCECVPEQPAP